jgi:hypothetical protein
MLPLPPRHRTRGDGAALSLPARPVEGVDGELAASNPMMTRADGEKWWPEFESVCLNDLSSTSQSDPQLFLSGGDEELFKAMAKIVVECMDYSALYSSQAPETLAGDGPSLVARHGEEAVFQMAKLIMSSEIHSLSASFQSLFDSFNRKYFSGALDRYRVRVVFDLHTVANEPLYGGHRSSGLIRFAERRIYIRYTDTYLMQGTLIHEMAHAATSGGHDERWFAEMARLKTAGAPVPNWELKTDDGEFIILEF